MTFTSDKNHKCSHGAIEAGIECLPIDQRVTAQSNLLSQLNIVEELQKHRLADYLSQNNNR